MREDITNLKLIEQGFAVGYAEGYIECKAEVIAYLSQFGIELVMKYGITQETAALFIADILHHIEKDESPNTIWEEMRIRELIGRGYAEGITQVLEVVSNLAKQRKISRETAELINAHLQELLE